MDANSLEESSQPNKRVKTNPVKHRSSHACQACRSRKVRCDVLTNGSRCTNCRLDQLECIVLASRRGKNKQTAAREISQILPSHPAEAVIPSRRTNSDPRTQIRSAQDDVISPIGSNAEAGTIPVVVTFDEDLDNDGIERQPTIEDSDVQEGMDAHPAAYDGLFTPGATTDLSEPYQSPVGNVLLPPFVSPLSPRVLSDDIHYLTTQGAFLVPEPDLQLEILRGYVFSVNPFLPVLDYKDFISAVVNKGEQGKISMLLFQAVMFAGLHSLQLPVIRKLGFETTKQAREVFFNRARLLYDFDVEPSSTAVLQSLILMSSWYSKGHERRQTWHWTGLAYDVARSMGLHREPTARRTSDKICRFRKRLWWSLYIRDRMIALGTRRPMRIRDDEFDVEMLTLDDFDISDCERQNDRTKDMFPNTDQMTSTALMCIQLAKLGVCIGHVVSSQYTTSTSQADVPYTMMVVPRRDETALEELEACNKRLDEWYQALDGEVQRPASSRSGVDPSSCSEVHWAILHLTHLTTVNVLHRAQVLHPSPEHTGTQTAPDSSRMKVKDAARKMTKLTLAMLHNDQARFLGLIGVTAIIAACLSHMLDIDSSDEDVRDASTLRLHQSIQVLQYLRGIYASADAAASFVASLTGQAGVPIPIQLASFGEELRHAGSRSFASHSPKHNQDSGVPTPYVRPGTMLTRSQPFRYPGQLVSTQGSQSLRSGAPAADAANHRLRNQRPASVDFFTTPIPRSDNSASDSRRDTPDHPAVSRQDIFQVDTRSIDPMLSAISSAPSFEWNGSVEGGMDFGLMSFNYDFYTDAFGFLDGCNFSNT